MKKLLLIVFAVYCTGLKSNNPINIKLSQNSSSYIYKDSKNLLWFSTTEGANIYDGKKIEVLKPGSYDMLGNNIQSSFYEDAGSNIWFTTYEALHIYERSYNRTEFFLLKDLNGNIISSDYSILLLEDNDLYVKTKSNIIIFDLVNRKQKACYPITLKNFTNTKAIRQPSINKLIIAGKENKKLTIIEYDLNTFSTNLILTKTALTKNIIPNNKQSGFYYFLDDELFEFNYKNETDLSIQKFNSSIIDICLIDQDKLLLLTQNEIFVFNLNNCELQQKVRILNEGNKTSIYSSNNGEIVFTVDKEGAYILSLNKIKFAHYHLRSNNIVGNVRSIKEIGTGEYFFCSRDNGITNFSKNFIVKNNLIINKKFKAVFDLETINNSVYANNGLDIYELDLHTNSLKNLNISKHDFIYDLFVNNNNDLYVLTGKENGFYKIEFNQNDNPSLNQVFHITEKNEFTSAYELKNGHLVLGVGANSISYFNKDSINYNFKGNHVITSDLKSIWETPNSKEIYLSSSTGLFHFPSGLEGNFTKLSDKKGLLDQTIYYILGHKEFLYLSSNQGLLRYNTMDSTVHQFTLADGIQGLEYNTTAGLKDRDGNFLFGGTNGINIFHPDSIKFLDYNTPIHLSNILVNDDEYDWEYNISLEDTIKFDYENNTLTFQFHGIDYSDPEAVELRCIMENYDKEWVNIEKNDASERYPNLPPGHYTFKMQATNSDKIWSNIVREIDVTITPPYWQTWWFRILSLLTIASISWLLIKSYYKRQLVKKDLELREQRLQFEKQEALQYERNRIAAEMHDDLGGGLTSIKFLAHRALKSKEDKNPKELIEKIIHHSANLINNMSEIIWAMNSGYDSLPNLISYIRNYLNKQCDEFELDLEVIIQKKIEEVEISGQKRRNIFLVIKEAFHNTLKYAEADKIYFEVKIESNNLTIKYKDNGKGFDEKEIVQGNGLKNMKRRVEEINGKWTLKSENGVELLMSFPLG